MLMPTQPTQRVEKLSTLPSSASACSQTTENLPYTTINNLSDLPTPTSQCPSVEVDTEPSCSRNIDSSPETSCINSNDPQDGILSVQDDNSNSASLSSISDNVISYIFGYFAKKYLLSNACINCEKFIIDGDKFGIIIQFFQI
ncbi:unnamed protein product [Larinioides sclopetarius]|uniref:Uncharacterized protein n=1 Tax=Larinioides sclopetarius TaxID=280406 RepID=A0AAV1ZPA6_9ARAC